MISAESVSRRHVLVAAGALYSRRLTAAKPPRILLRSSWQSVNIGDIGHTPGALASPAAALSRSRDHALAGPARTRLPRTADKEFPEAQDRRGNAG